MTYWEWALAEYERMCEREKRCNRIEVEMNSLMKEMPVLSAAEMAMLKPADTPYKRAKRHVD